MFRKPSPEDLKLKEQINAVLDSMSTFDPETPQYYKLSKRLAELNELKKSNKDAGRIDSNTALLVAGNLLGIVIIVAYEHAHVVTSKGLTLLTKVK